MSFQPVFNNFVRRPPSATQRYPGIVLYNSQLQLIRDQLAIPTWLLLGATIQGIASVCLPYRNIVLILPGLLALSYKVVTTALTLCGLLENSHMKGVIPARTSVVLPTEKGLPEKPGQSSVCAIMLGVKSNHPLGMFGPGFKEAGDRFSAMVDEVSKDATKHGFLGSSSWLNISDRKTASENMVILYFENEHYMHAYAHGPMHSEGTRWWRETEKELPHLGIMHEVFACPKGSWEGIYINYQPVGLGATTKEVTDDNGQKSWASPLVKIRGKTMLYSKGRMGRGVGEKEWESVGVANVPE